MLVLELALLDAYRDTTSVFLCEGETYEWNGGTYGTAGVYVDTLASATGCDSILVLQIDVIRSFVETTETICVGETYEWNGGIYDSTGIYVDTVIHSSGCVSVLQLDLAVVGSHADTTYAEICVGETYDWNGVILSAAGIYTDTLTSAGGCDSVLVLELELLDAYRDSVYAEICVGESYDWNGLVLSAAGIYTDTLIS